MVLLEPMVKGDVDMLGDAGPPLALEKLGAGERRDTVSGATLRGDWRSREPDMPISTPCSGDTNGGSDGGAGACMVPQPNSPGVQGRC